MEESISSYDCKIWKAVEKIYCQNRHILISYLGKNTEIILSHIKEGKCTGMTGHGRKIYQIFGSSDFSL